MSAAEPSVEVELEKLIAIIKRAVPLWKKNNKPIEKTLMGRKFRRFRYYDLNDSFSGEDLYTVREEDWSNAKYPIVYQQIKPLKEYQETLQLLQSRYPNFKTEYLADFCLRAAEVLLKNKARGFLSPANLMRAFISELQDEPVNCRISLELSGVMLTTPKMKILPSITLERLTKNDGERAVPMEDFYENRGSCWSAKTRLRVEMKRKKDDISFHQWELLMGIFRLYKVSEVHVNAHQETSPTCLSRYGFRDDIHYNTDHFSIFPAILKKKDRASLAKFWKALWPRLPDSFKVPGNQRDSLTIAYERYLDAMTHPGNEEMRIAYGISGLEALLSKEKDELKYRLRMRTARLLGIMGMDADKIYRDVGLAYDVRSRFDHGDKMDKDQRNAIRKTYNSITERPLTLIILDYVRICMVIQLMIKTNKQSLIDLIDKSWISKKELKKLQSVLVPAKRLLRLETYRPKYVTFAKNRSLLAYVES